MRDATTTSSAPAGPGGGEMSRAYRPSEIEPVIYERWLAADVFAPDGAGSRARADQAPFTIIQPPPNVTGSLHLGHAQRSAVEDLMTRHARMHNDNNTVTNDVTGRWWLQGEQTSSLLT